MYFYFCRKWLRWMCTKAKILLEYLNPVLNSKTVSSGLYGPSNSMKLLLLHKPSTGKETKASMSQITKAGEEKAVRLTNWKQLKADFGCLNVKHTLWQTHSLDQCFFFYLQVLEIDKDGTGVGLSHFQGLSFSVRTLSQLKKKKEKYWVCAFVIAQITKAPWILTMIPTFPMHSKE